MKVARFRPLAIEDLVARTSCYRAAEDDALADRFFRACFAAVRPVEQMPGIGSPLPGEKFQVPGLRSCPVRRFPVNWYYFERDDHLDFLRLLATSQDLDELLHGHG